MKDPEMAVKSPSLLYAPQKSYSPCILFTLLCIAASLLTALIALGQVHFSRLPELPKPISQTLSDYVSHKGNNYIPTKATNFTSLVPECDSSNCKLPACHCASTSHPGNFPLREVPMMVMVTFDDHINQFNYPNFERLFNLKLKTPSGCPAKFTYFVSHIATDYKYIKQVYSMGHEIGSHSTSHRFPVTWWYNATKDELTDEFVGVRSKLVKEASIPQNEIRGVRVPFLAVNGDPLMQMIQSSGFKYDTTLVSKFSLMQGDSAMWPFTMDHPPIDYLEEISLPINGKYPGIWEVPLAKYNCLDGRGGYFMLDECPQKNDTLGIHAYLWRYFSYHYRTKAPMGIFMHATWFTRNSASLDGLAKFLEDLSTMPDVWLVSVNQVLDWMKQPTPISNILNFDPWRC